MHLRRVEAERLDHGAVDRRMIRFRMRQWQSQILVERKAAHLAHVVRFLLDKSGERLIGGQRARAGGQAEHRVRLGLDQIGHGARVDLARLGLVLDDDDFRHGFLLSLIWGWIWGWWMGYGAMGVEMTARVRWRPCRPAPRRSRRRAGPGRSGTGGRADAAKRRSGLSLRADAARS